MTFDPKDPTILSTIATAAANAPDYSPTDPRTQQPRIDPFSIENITFLLSGGFNSHWLGRELVTLDDALLHCHITATSWAETDNTLTTEIRSMLDRKETHKERMREYMRKYRQKQADELGESLTALATTNPAQLTETQRHNIETEQARLAWRNAVRARSAAIAEHDSLVRTAHAEYTRMAAIAKTLKPKPVSTKSKPTVTHGTTYYESITKNPDSATSTTTELNPLQKLILEHQQNQLTEQQ